MNRLNIPLTKPVPRPPLSVGDRIIVAALITAAVFACLGALVFGMGGCHVGELAAPCDTMTLEQVKTECRDAVRANCTRPGGHVDESCPTLIECHERIERWRLCSPAVDAGAGGSQ